MATNQNFARSLKLDYVILSDPSRKTAQAFGVIGADRKFARRWTFYIDKDGIVSHIDKRVNVSRHGNDIAARLETLRVAKVSGQTGTGQRPVRSAGKAAPKRTIAKAIEQQSTPKAAAQDLPEGSLAAMEASVQWLIRNQEPDGRWSSRKHGGTKDRDVAVTSLALLALAGLAYTERTGRYQTNVRRAIAWLISQQSASGAIGSKDSDTLGYDHALAGLALADAYAFSRIQSTGASARKAAEYTCQKHQIPFGAWGQKPRGSADPVVTFWMTYQLKMALDAHIKVPASAFQGLVSWQDTVSVKGSPGYSRTRGGKFDRVATAAIIYERLMMGWPPSEMAAASDLLLKRPPKAESLDLRYLWISTLAMHAMGNKRSKTWNRSVSEMLVRKQRKKGRARGSWDLLGGAAKASGRAYSTAVGALCLEIHLRFTPPAKRK